MIVLRRLDAVLEGSKQAVLDMKTTLDTAGVVEQDPALRQAAGQAFYNTSKFTLRDLRARASRQQLKADFEAYLDGFSPNVQDILENFEFRNQIPRLSKADALGTLVEKLTSPDVNLSPAPVKNAAGTVKHPGLDNHGMGSIFEELVRRFNEENNEEAGEHWTPRDAVRLMAKLVFLPVAEEIKSGTYLLYDGACGTGGMLTVAEETLRQLAAEHGKDVSTHLYGQEINAETYAICKADLLLKGDGEAADNIVGGPEHSTLANDAFPSREFDFMLSNPPYGKSWKTDLERMGGKKDMRDPRFVIEHAGDAEYSLVTRSSDGQMLFLANKLSKMKQGTAWSPGDCSRDFETDGLSWFCRNSRCESSWTLRPGSGPWSAPSPAAIPKCWKCPTKPSGSLPPMWTQERSIDRNAPMRSMSPLRVSPTWTCSRAGTPGTW